jgi:hypothetical protein
MFIISFAGFLRVSESPQTTTSQQSNKEGFFSRFFGRIGRQLENLTYVEVVTAAGDPKTQIDPEASNVLDTLNQVSVLARTRIELDGDIVEILPMEQSGQASINKDVMDIHKENTAAAVQNWNNFMNTILNVVSMLGKLAGMSPEEMKNSLHLSLVSPIPPPPTPTPTPT